MYQIKDVSTGQYHRNIQGKPIQWETRGEATKFAQLNYPEQLISGGVAVIRVFRLSSDRPDHSVYRRTVQSILGMMTVADQWEVLQDLFDSLNKQPDTQPNTKPNQESNQENQYRDL